MKSKAEMLRDAAIAGSALLALYLMSTSRGYEGAVSLAVSFLISRAEDAARGEALKASEERESREREARGRDRSENALRDFVATIRVEDTKFRERPNTYEPGRFYGGLGNRCVAYRYLGGDPYSETSWERVS